MRSIAYLLIFSILIFHFPFFFHFDRSEVKSTTVRVIREVYEGDEHERFEAELEKALEATVNYIIIEPQRLGDETARWIAVGNCLHKTAVISGIASIVCGSLWPERPVFNTPLCAVSIFCTGLYTISWNVDYCCQYQVRDRVAASFSLHPQPKCATNNMISLYPLRRWKEIRKS